MFGLFKKEKSKNSSLHSKILMPQVRILESEGNMLHVNQVTYIYLMIAQATLNGGKTVQLPDIKKILDAALTGDEYRMRIENGYGVAASIQNFDELCQELGPIVASDLSADRPSFLVRYTHHAMEEIKKMFEPDPDYDPREQVRNPLSEI